MSESTPDPPVSHMLVLRNTTCGHVLVAASKRDTLIDRQALIVTILDRYDFRIQTVTADQATTALLDLAHGIRCPTCTLEPLPEGPNPS